MKIFACYHKKFPVIQNEIIVPIQVGHALAQTDLGFLTDDTGDNISAKNPYFCELTATYYIWKNIKEDVVGLMHYRRYLNFKNNDTKFNKITPDFASRYGLEKENIATILQDYDIILPNQTKHRSHQKTIMEPIIFKAIWNLCLKQSKKNIRK